MHRFKRFYLLFSLVLSITIPFVSIEISGDSSLVSNLPFTEVRVITNEIEFTNEQIVVQEEDEAGKPLNIVLIGYAAIAGILLSRFLVNIARLMITIKKNEQAALGNLRMVLTDTESVPHSFGHYIFLNKNEYKAGLIEEEVLTHEMTHVRQWHTLDILLIELLLILFWFNPVLYLYKNRIKLNHEFLADEGVISAYNDVPHYQMILIDKISRQNSLSLTSNFNYLLTKKRLTMMTKTTSARIVAMKRVIVLPLIPLLAFTFCTKKMNEQATGDGKEPAVAVVQDRVEPLQDTILKKIVQEDTSKTKIVVHFIPPKIVKDGEKVSSPPPLKTTDEYIPPKIVKDEETLPSPPPRVTVKGAEIDWSSYKVGDTFTDDNGREWTVTSVNPPKLNPVIKIKVEEKQNEQRPE
jgi:hypothetical protein